MNAALTIAQAAFPTQLARLGTLLSITRNEQTDGAPYSTAAAGTGSGYVVTALRIHVKVAGADALDLAVVLCRPRHHDQPVGACAPSRMVSRLAGARTSTIGERAQPSSGFCSPRAA